MIAVVSAFIALGLVWLGYDVGIRDAKKPFNKLTPAQMQLLKEMGKAIRENSEKHSTFIAAEQVKAIRALLAVIE